MRQHQPTTGQTKAKSSMKHKQAQHKGCTPRGRSETTAEVLQQSLQEGKDIRGDVNNLGRRAPGLSSKICPVDARNRDCGDVLKNEDDTDRAIAAGPKREAGQGFHPEAVRLQAKGDTPRTCRDLAAAATAASRTPGARSTARTRLERNRVRTRGAAGPGRRCRA